MLLLSMYTFIVVDVIYFDFAQAFDTVPGGRVFHMGSKHDMDTFIYDRKVSVGSGEWCRLKLVTGYKWNSAGQCIRATYISAVRQ